MESGAKGDEHRDLGSPRRHRLLAEGPPDAGDRLVDNLLGAEAVGHDAVHGRAEVEGRTLALDTDRLLPVEAVGAPDVRLAQGLHCRLLPVRVARVEPERL